MPALRGQALCFRHSPTTVQRRKAASAKGGRAGRAVQPTVPADVRSISDLQDHLGLALAAIEARPVTTRRANVIARLVQVAAALVRDHELEQRLDEIEDTLRRDNR